MQSYTAFPNSPNKNSKMCVFLYKMAPIYPLNATKQQKKDEPSTRPFFSVLF